MWLLECSEGVESKLQNLETSSSVIISPIVSVLHILNILQVIQSLPMTGLEPWTAGFGSNRSTN